MTHSPRLPSQPPGTTQARTTVTRTASCSFEHFILSLPVFSPSAPLLSSLQTYSTPRSHPNPHRLRRAYTYMFFCGYTYSTGQPAHLSSCVARASLFGLKTKQKLHALWPTSAELPADCSSFFLPHRGASQSARAPGLWWPSRSTRTHKHSGLPRMCNSHPHACLVLPFTCSFAHHTRK